MSDSESTGGKYDSDDSFFDPAAEYAWLGEYGKLLRACGFMGSAKAARRLLDAGVPIKGPRGEPTPLACAIQHNMVDIARLLVARGADVNKRDRDITPVFRACGLIDNSILKLLLSSGASPSVACFDTTPMFKALEVYDGEKAQLLLAHGAGVDEEVPYVEWSRHPVFDPPLPEEGGGTPLERACRFCQPHAVRFLLANGAAWDRANRYGETPLFYARKSTDKLWMMMNRYFDGCLEKYWTLRLGLRVIGRRSAAQQLVLEDTYLANYLGSFVVGEFVLSNRPTYPPDPVYVIPSGLPQPEVPSWVELVARPR